MNLLNRILVIVATLAAVALLTVAAAAPAETLAVLLAALTALKGLADRLLPTGRLLVGAIGLAANVVLLFWLWLEIRRPRRRTVRVQQANGAQAEVTTDTLTERLETEVDALAGVTWVKARVRSTGKAVEVRIEAEIMPGTPVAVTTGHIAETVRTVVETAMGLRLRGKPKVRIKAVRLPEIPLDLPPYAPDELEPEAEGAGQPQEQAAEPTALPLPPPS